MFERFTHAARDVVVRAQAEARDLNQSPTGTQHVLLALLADPGAPFARALADYGVDAEFVRGDIVRRVGPHPPDLSAAAAEQEDAEALKAIGIDLDAVRRAIEQNFGPGSLRLPRAPEPKRRGLLRKFYGSSGHVPFSPRNKKVLELSLREALRLKQKFIAPEHIMLGLLREGQGLAALILADRGVDFDRLREDMERSVKAAA